MSRQFPLFLLIYAFLLAGMLLVPASVQALAAPTPPSPQNLFLPLLTQKQSVSACQSLPGVQYSSLPIISPPSDRPAAQHPDLNLALRGYTVTRAERALVWIDGPTDVMAPQLNTLFSDQRLPDIAQVFQVYDWDWTCNCRGKPITRPEVTLTALQTSPGEVLHTPSSGYTVGSGYQAMVLYADPGQLTLKYTREDNVVYGYTIHLVGLCVNPALVARYRQDDAAGRGQLPALVAGQPLGSALSDGVLVAIRDTGNFMDPRSQKDWWRLHRWLF